AVGKGTERGPVGRIQAVVGVVRPPGGGCRPARTLTGFRQYCLPRLALAAGKANANRLTIYQACWRGRQFGGALTRRRFGGGLGRAPFLGQAEAERQQHRPDEDADEAEGQDAAEDAEQK